MKIAVVGCGAVGSYYGARLCRAGHETHFLLRSDYQTVRRFGVRVRSPQGNFTVRPRAADRPEKIGACDLVVIALKTTANDALAGLLPRLVGAKTVLLTLQNGLGNEESLARLYPADQIMGGLCFVCLNRTAPGIVDHIAHGMIVTGEFGGWPEPRTHDIAAAFRAAGVPCKVTADLARAHWEKLVWNIPFNGLGVAGLAGYEAVVSGKLSRSQAANRCVTTDKLLADPKWAALVRGLMNEVIDASRALGLKVQKSLAETQIKRTLTMGEYRASTLLDYERGLPLELETLFLEPLRRAKTAGVETPILKNLCKVLVGLDKRRAGE